MVAEVTGAVISQELTKAPIRIKRYIARRALSAANNDTITFGGLATIKAVLALCAEDGTVGTFSFTNNVLTLTNGGTKTWTAIVEGV